MEDTRAAGRSEAGVALLILLVVVLALALVGLAMANNVLREAQIAVAESDAVQAHYLAEAGIAVGATQLSQNNTWVGPLTQTLGSGSFTVQVDIAVSTSSVKSIVSTGQVGGSISSARQTVRENVMVIPKAFTRSLLSNTIVMVNNVNLAGTIVPNIVSTRVGSIHANNLNTEPTAVSVRNLGTIVTGRITASRGAISIDPLAICIACDPATNQPTMPFPTFNWQHYISLALANPSPCPSVNATGTFFVTQKAFDLCVALLPPDAQGFRTMSGVVFLQIPTFSLPQTSSESLMRFLGTLVVYNTSANGCNPLPNVCGDITFNPATLSFPNDLIFTAQNGEPAILAGGSLLTLNATCSRPSTSPGTISITGLVYFLAGTTDPTLKPPADPGYCLPGSSTTPVTIRGALVGTRVNGFNSNSITYEPSVLQQLPSGLNPLPSGSFWILPISWSRR